MKMSIILNVYIDMMMCVRVRCVRVCMTFRSNVKILQQNQQQYNK